MCKYSSLSEFFLGHLVKVGFVRFDTLAIISVKRAKVFPMAKNSSVCQVNTICQRKTTGSPKLSRSLKKKGSAIVLLTVS